MSARKIAPKSNVVSIHERRRAIPPPSSLEEVTSRFPIQPPALSSFSEGRQGLPGNTARETLAGGRVPDPKPANPDEITKVVVMPGEHKETRAKRIERRNEVAFLLYIGCEMLRGEFPSLSEVELLSLEVILRQAARKALDSKGKVKPEFIANLPSSLAALYYEDAKKIA
jgi:hypothetical protein